MQIGKPSGRWKLLKLLPKVGNDKNKTSTQMRWQNNLEEGANIVKGVTQSKRMNGL